MVKNIMKNWTLVLFTGVVLICCKNPPDPIYDLVIRNGTLIDGTGAAALAGDLAVVDDRIVAIGTIPGTGKSEIDATGLVVAPGFIDIHSHSEYVILKDGNAQSKIRQGVTTEVFGEKFSPGPFLGEMNPRVVDTEYGRDTISSLKDYFEIVEKNGVAVNILSYVGIGNVWQSVMGYDFEAPDEEQWMTMLEIVHQAMKDGAFGLSSQLAEIPGSLIETKQVVELCKVVSQYGGIYATHMRNEGLEVFKAVQEAIEIGENAKVPVDIFHLKIADQQYWGRMNEIVELISSARARGVDVYANVYPYTRGSNNLVTIIPPWAHQGGVESMLARLENPETRARIKRDIENGIEGWYNHYTAIGKDWSRMLLCEGEYAGMAMDTVIAMRATNSSEPLEVYLDLLIENGGSISTVYAHHTEEDMNLAMIQPWCSIGSDGYAYAIEGPLRQGNPHPRSFGTFPRVLGLYSRERQLISLEEAVYKMTGLNARKLGITDRGSLVEGSFADITLFDPEEIIDKAHYLQPFQYNAGIRYVMVNGTMVLEGETHTNKRPGQVLRNSQPSSLSKSD
jgi:N-acyl-D-aspartate/D-glutamate deacylase